MHLVEGLFELISDGTDLERSLALNFQREPDLSASLAFDASVPIAIALDILVTGGRGGLRSYVIEAKGPKGPVSLPFSIRWTSPPGAGAENERGCWTPSLFVASDGIFVGLAPAPGQPGAPILLAGEAHRCPTIRRAAPLDQIQEVEALLDDLSKRTPLCAASDLSAEPGVRWGDVVPFFASLGRRGVVYFEATPRATNQCAMAVAPEALDEELGPSAR